MTKKQLKKLYNEISILSDNFEQLGPDNIKVLKKEFDLHSIKSPLHYLEIARDIEELYLEARLLFLYSVFINVCKEEGKIYYFDQPYQSYLRFDAVVRKDKSFYLLDEAGDFHELLISEDFMKFIDQQYWELYET